MSISSNLELELQPAGRRRPGYVGKQIRSTSSYYYYRYIYIYKSQINIIIYIYSKYSLVNSIVIMRQCRPRPFTLYIRMRRRFFLKFSFTTRYSMRIILSLLSLIQILILITYYFTYYARVYFR